MLSYCNRGQNNASIWAISSSGSSWSLVLQSRTDMYRKLKTATMEHIKLPTCRRRIDPNMLMRLIRNFSARRTENEYFTKCPCTAKQRTTSRGYRQDAASCWTDVIIRDYNTYKIKRQIGESVKQEREGRKRSPDIARIRDAISRRHVNRDLISQRQ